MVLLWVLDECRASTVLGIRMVWLLVIWTMGDSYVEMVYCRYVGEITGVVVHGSVRSSGRFVVHLWLLGATDLF